VWFLYKENMGSWKQVFARAIFIVSHVFLIGDVMATPFIPSNDQEVLERLPFKAQDPINQKIKALRLEVQKNPNDLKQVVLLARTYFQLAGSEGDPRYIGYAQSIIQPWSSFTHPPIEIVLVRGLLFQFSHDFEKASSAFSEVLFREPLNGEAISWLVDLNIVQANYVEAQKYNQLFLKASLNENKFIYDAMIAGIHGQSKTAYQQLFQFIQNTPKAHPELKEWVLIRLAEMAVRLNDPVLAEKNFKEALTMDPQDAFGIAAYCDFLLDQKRMPEVIALTKNKKNSDILLLRLAQAAFMAKTDEASSLINALEDRFNAANLRGDRLHLMEESRYQLKLKNNPTKALELAKLNWKKQREPKDARCFLEAALAAKNVREAQAVLQWMRETNYEDPLFVSLQQALLRLQK
jgi:Tfp pilus assembly protein PilF